MLGGVDAACCGAACWGGIQHDVGEDAACWGGGCRLSGSEEGRDPRRWNLHPLYGHPAVKRPPLPLARVPVFLWIPYGRGNQLSNTMAAAERVLSARPCSTKGKASSQLEHERYVIL